MPPGSSQMRTAQTALVKIVDLIKFNPTDACQITRIEQSLKAGQQNRYVAR